METVLVETIHEVVVYDDSSGKNFCEIVGFVVCCRSKREYVALKKSHAFLKFLRFCSKSYSTVLLTTMPELFETPQQASHPEGSGASEEEGQGQQPQEEEQAPTRRRFHVCFSSVVAFAWEYARYLWKAIGDAAVARFLKTTNPDDELDATLARAPQGKRKHWSRCLG